MSRTAGPELGRQLLDELEDLGLDLTSSAVVGSSARISFGSHDSAIAIITRWRIPPENWNG